MFQTLDLSNYKTEMLEVIGTYTEPLIGECNEDLTA